MGSSSNFWRVPAVLPRHPRPARVASLVDRLSPDVPRLPHLHLCRAPRGRRLRPLHRRSRRVLGHLRNLHDESLYDLLAAPPLPRPLHRPRPRRHVHAAPLRHQLLLRLAPVPRARHICLGQRNGQRLPPRHNPIPHPPSRLPLGRPRLRAPRARHLLPRPPPPPPTPHPPPRRPAHRMVRLPRSPLHPVHPRRLPLLYGPLLWLLLRASPLSPSTPNKTNPDR